jgi:hypothetical protein
MMLQNLDDFFLYGRHKHAVPTLWGSEEYKTTSRTRFGYLWIAEIDYFRPHIRNLPRFPGLPAIAIAKTKNWYRGALLIPPIFEPFDRLLGGPASLSPVDLTGWTDPVAVALQSTDLLLNHNHAHIAGHVLVDVYAAPYPFHINLYFESAASSGTLSLECDFAWYMPTKRLQLALLQCFYFLAEQYNHEEMTRFLADGKEDFEWFKEIMAERDNNKPMEE